MTQGTDRDTRPSAFPSDTVEGLVRRVDELMYQSKAAGRNRVTLTPGQVFRPSR